METYLAAAYWGPRKEPVEVCARRASAFLISLSQVSDDFRQWRLLGRSHSKAMQTVVDNGALTDSLAELFMIGRNRRDLGAEVIDELGYRISVWNGGDHETAASLTMKCGLYSTVAGLSNAVTLKLPASFEITSIDQIVKVVTALAVAWDPDWAIIASRSTLDRNANSTPFLDKALYVNSAMQVSDDISEVALGRELEHGLLFVSS